MSREEQMTSIQEYHTRSGHIFWRKVYTLAVLSALSAFVIIYVHFGDYFVVNESDPIACPSIREPIDKEIQKYTNESDSIEKSSNEESEKSPIEDVNDNDTSVIDEALRNAIEEQFLILNGKLDVMDRSYSSVSNSIQTIIATNAEVNDKINNLTETVNSVEEEVIDIQQKLAELKSDLALVVSSQQEMKTQMNSILNTINDLVTLSQTTEKSKKEKKKNK